MSIKSAIAIACLVFLSGCGYQGSVADSDKNKNIECTDTRDGEKFSFNTSSVRNVTIGIGSPHTMDITDSNGVVRHISSAMDAYMKCHEVKK